MSIKLIKSTLMNKCEGHPIIITLPSTCVVVVKNDLMWYNNFEEGLREFIKTDVPQVIKYT